MIYYKYFFKFILCPFVHGVSGYEEFFLVCRLVNIYTCCFMVSWFFCDTGASSSLVQDYFGKSHIFSSSTCISLPFFTFNLMHLCICNLFWFKVRDSNPVLCFYRWLASNLHKLYWTTHLIIPTLLITIIQNGCWLFKIFSALEEMVIWLSHFFSRKYELLNNTGILEVNTT